MGKRWSANNIVLAALGGILLLVAVDVGRNLIAGPPPESVPDLAAVTPDFRVGDLAPDFKLPDALGKEHSLSELVKRQTILTFICGCEMCRGMHRYIRKVRAKMGDRAPDVISVSTTKAEAEEAYLRDVKLPHKVLYDEQKGPVMTLYRGHPCPRVYGLDGERRVQWICASPRERPHTELIQLEVARHLGFRIANETNSKPKAPEVEIVSGPEIPGMQRRYLPTPLPRETGPAGLQAAAEEQRGRRHAGKDH